MTQHNPGHYGNAEYDLTGHVGGIGSNCSWPMYSFDRPAHILWNAIGKQLHAQGWTDFKIKEWLQSVAARHALDGELSDQIAAVGTEYAKTIKKLGRA